MTVLVLVQVINYYKYVAGETWVKIKMVLFLVLVPFVSLFIGCTEIQITVYTYLYSFCVFLKRTDLRPAI